MTALNTADALYQQGRLGEAIAALDEELRSKPNAIDRRGFLAELLCVQGDLDRAEKQLDTIGRLAPDRQVGVSLLRQLVRAAQWQQQFHAEGRLPEFVEKPDVRMELRLKAAIELRAGNSAEATRMLTELEAARQPLRGECGGAPFGELRDLDDLLSDSLELLTSTGKYYLVPLARVVTIELRKPERPRDLLWRRAAIEVRDGPEGEVFLPTIYVASYGPEETPLRLGRQTDWSPLGGREGGPVRGRGLKTWLVGEEARTLLEVERFAIGSEV